MAKVQGQEVTATLPEHTNMFGVEPRFDLNLRGGCVEWWGLDIAELFQAIRDRGARVVQLNHPREGCNYMCLIEYNRITGLPGMTDPTRLGFDAGAALWDWNFDVLEYQNGNQQVFIRAGHEKDSGTFEDWMSFLNLGHKITAAANTDVHNWGIPGCPRNYFPSSTDHPAEFDQDELMTALLNGRVVASTGAFARVNINGTAGMGDLVTDTDGAVDLSVHIEAAPEIDVTHFKVFVNCDQAVNAAATSPAGVVKYDGTLAVPVSADAHIVVLGFGHDYLPRGLPQFDPTQVPRFTANAIYVDADGNGVFDPPGGKTCTYSLP